MMAYPGEDKLNQVRDIQHRVFSLKRRSLSCVKREYERLDDQLLRMDGVCCESGIYDENGEYRDIGSFTKDELLELDDAVKSAEDAAWVLNYAAYVFDCPGDEKHCDESLYARNVILEYMDEFFEFAKFNGYEMQTLDEVIPMSRPMTTDRLLVVCGTSKLHTWIQTCVKHKEKESPGYEARYEAARERFYEIHRQIMNLEAEKSDLCDEFDLSDLEEALDPWQYLDY